MMSVDEIRTELGKRWRPDSKAFSRRTIERWRRFLGMPYSKAGGSVGFRLEDVEKWAQRTFSKSPQV